MLKFFDHWHYSLISIITGIPFVIFINASYAITHFQQGNMEYLIPFGIIVIAEFSILCLTIYYLIKRPKLSSAMKAVIYGSTLIVFLSLIIWIPAADGALRELLRTVLVVVATIYFIAVGIWSYLKSGTKSVS